MRVPVLIIGKFLFFVLMMLPVACPAQTVSYSYDQAGNRISRKVISLPPPPQSAKKQPTDSVVVEDVLGGRTILVYPNPTKGALGIEITGGDRDEDIRMRLYNGQGVMLYNAHVNQGTNPVDMTTYPKGWYILRIQTGEKLKEFKVIKE